MLQRQSPQKPLKGIIPKQYLNAEKWIGISKYEECAKYAQKIINGEYGNYGKKHKESEQ